MNIWDVSSPYRYSNNRTIQKEVRIDVDKFQVLIGILKNNPKKISKI